MRRRVAVQACFERRPAVRATPFAERPLPQHVLRGSIEYRKQSILMSSNYLQCRLTLCSAPLLQVTMVCRCLLCENIAVDACICLNVMSQICGTHIGQQWCCMRHAEPLPNVWTSDLHARDNAVNMFDVRGQSPIEVRHQHRNNHDSNAASCCSVAPLAAVRHPSGDRAAKLKATGSSSAT